MIGWQCTRALPFGKSSRNRVNIRSTWIPCWSISRHNIDHAELWKIIYKNCFFSGSLESRRGLRLVDVLSYLLFNVVLEAGIQFTCICPFKIRHNQQRYATILGSWLSSIIGHARSRFTWSFHRVLFTSSLLMATGSIANIKFVGLLCGILVSLWLWLPSGCVWEMCLSHSWKSIITLFSASPFWILLFFILSNRKMR